MDNESLVPYKKLLFTSIKVKAENAGKLLVFRKQLVSILQERFNAFFEDFSGLCDETTRKLLLNQKHQLYLGYYIATNVRVHEVLAAGTEHISDPLKHGEATLQLLERISLPDLIDEIFQMPSFVLSIAKRNNDKVKLYSSQIQARYARLIPFDRTKYDQQDLFAKAKKLYDETIKTKRSYTYKAALEDANKLDQSIDAEEFDRDFENINRNFTNHRKNKLR